jgi:hypothetical protein
MDPYISIGKESIEKESELIDISLETNEKETKDETEIMDQLSPLGDLLKNKKEESCVNTME